MNDWPDDDEPNDNSLIQTTKPLKRYDQVKTPLGEGRVWESYEKLGRVGVEKVKGYDRPIFFATESVEKTQKLMKEMNWDNGGYSGLSKILTEMGVQKLSEVVRKKVP